MLVRRLGLCCTQVKLWAAFLHSSDRSEIITTGSCMQSRIPPHLYLKRVGCLCFLAVRTDVQGAILFFKVLVGSAGVWRWVLVMHIFSAVPALRLTGFHVTEI